MNDEQDNQQPTTPWDKSLDRLKQVLGGDEANIKAGVPDLPDDINTEDQADASETYVIHSGTDDDNSNPEIGTGDPTITNRDSATNEIDRLRSAERQLQLSTDKLNALQHELSSTLKENNQLRQNIKESLTATEALEIELEKIRARYSKGWMQHTEIDNATKASRKEEWESYIAWLGSHIAAQADGNLVSPNPLIVRALDLSALLRSISQTDPDGLVIVSTDDGKPLVLNPIDTTVQHLELATHLSLAIASALTASDVVEPDSPAPEMDDHLELLVRQLQSLEAERSGFESGLATHLANALLSTVSCLAVSRYRSGDASLDAAEVVTGAMTATVAWLEAILPTYSPSTAPNRRIIERELAKSLPRSRIRAWLLGGNARATEPANISNVSELLGLIAGGKVNSGYDRTTVMSAASMIQKTLDEYTADGSDRAVGAAIIVELICDHWRE